MTATITLWSPGDPPLTDLQHANNIRGLYELMTGLQASSGAVGVDNITLTALAPGVPAILMQLNDGRIFGPFQLPAATMNWKGPRVVGTFYQARDVITAAPSIGGTVSTYHVILDHEASANLNDDLMAGRIGLMASGGQDAENVRGNYNALTAYLRRDVVFKDGVFWRATADAPVGSPSPGAAGSVWAIALYTSVPLLQTIGVTGGARPNIEDPFHDVGSPLTVRSRTAGLQGILCASRGSPPHGDAPDDEPR
ncbi:MAG: hypothetical protein B7Z14_09055 [Bosea sp. 32-68-6]|nr:MAG: hypothetical protein B7Z14_09055 [Bosea sp. 32-68-6]